MRRRRSTIPRNTGTLPNEFRRSGVIAREQMIVGTDAPEWTASERAVNAAHDAEIGSILPTTMADVMAMLEFHREWLAGDHYPDRRFFYRAMAPSLAPLRTH